MLTLAEIRAAFATREKPASLVSNGRGDTLELDARHFQDLSWEEVSFADWRDYSDAVAGMNADAFCYFLPSIMSLSLGGLDGAALVGDNLIGLLDTSSDPHLWHEFFVERFQKLNADELEALQKWVCVIADDISDAVTLQRVNDTVHMLRLLKG
jgi:hypothetical protein